MLDKHSPLTPFPVLKTSRLTLRDIRLQDAKAIFKMRSNKAVNRFIARPGMDDPKNAETLVKSTIEAYEKGLAIGWAGILRENDEIIGTCGFNKIDKQNKRAEIGGELATEYWGKNIALEAVEAIVNYGFSKMGLHRIEAFVDPKNKGAIALMEALGFEHEALFRDKILFEGKYLDMAVYARLNA